MKLLLPLAVALCARCGLDRASLLHSRRGGRGRGRRRIRVAIMTDCEGAFGFGYELDIGGAQAASPQYAALRRSTPKKPSAGMNGGSGRGHGPRDRRVRLRRRHAGRHGSRGDPAADGAARRRHHDRPALRRRGGGGRELRHRQSGRRRSSSARPARRIRRSRSHPRTSSATTATAPSGTPDSARSSTSASAGGTRRSSWTTTASAGRRRRHHRRLLRCRRQDHEAGLPAAEHDRLRVVHPAAPAPGQVDGYFWVVGGTGTGAALKAFEQAYGALNPRQHIGTLFFAFLGNFKVVAPQLVGAYVGGFGTGPGLQTRSRRWRTRPSWPSGIPS